MKSLIPLKWSKSFSLRPVTLSFGIHETPNHHSRGALTPQSRREFFLSEKGGPLALSVLFFFLLVLVWALCLSVFLSPSLHIHVHIEHYIHLSSSSTSPFLSLPFWKPFVLVSALPFQLALVFHLQEVLVFASQAVLF